MRSEKINRPCGNKRCVETNPINELPPSASLIFHAWAPEKKRPKRAAQLALTKAPVAVIERLERLKSCVTTGISVAYTFLDDDSLWECGAHDTGDAVHEARASAVRALHELEVPESCAWCIAKRAFAAVDFDDDCDE